MNATVYRTVMERAAGRCEADGVAGPLHLDHFFGRAKAPETVENCWALCHACDGAKTLNHPDAATWLRRFIDHAVVYGYEAAAVRARNRLIFVEARTALSPFGRLA